MHEHITHRVTIVIPVYRAQFLDRCLASVFAQTRPAEAVIVVDDGSPERAAIDSAVARYPGCVVLLRQENRGAGAARNRGILASQTPLVAFLDADDEWAPEFLERQLALIGRMPHWSLVYANGIVIGDTPLHGTRFMDVAPSAGTVDLEALLAQRCSVLTSSVVVQRRALLGVGLFDEELRRGQDFDLWVRLAAAGVQIAFSREPLVKRRIHGQNLSGDRISELERAVGVLSRLREKLALTSLQRDLLNGRVRMLRSQIATEQGKRTLAAGEVLVAASFFRQAAADGGGWKSRMVHLALQIAPGLTRQAYLFKLRRGAASASAQAV